MNENKFYSNSTQINGSLYDLELVFCKKETVSVSNEQRDSNPDEVVNKYLASVTLSWQHAKVLASILSEQVKKYEDTFGVINVQSKSEKNV